VAAGRTASGGLVRPAEPFGPAAVGRSAVPDAWRLRDNGCERRSQMNVFGRLFGLFAAFLAISSIGAAIGAIATKRRIVPVDSPEADEVTLRAIFEPVNFRSTAKNFRGGTVDCWYGGGIIDLRDATLDPSGARLEVRGIFGGGQIVVPDSWRVTTNVMGMGGVGDSRARAERPVTAPLLVVDGFVFMGGFGITSDVPQEQIDAVAQAVAARQGKVGQPIIGEAEPTPVV
jgi:hypothetical protein